LLLGKERDLWAFQNEDTHQPGGISVGAMTGSNPLTSLSVPNAVNLFCPTMSAPTVDLTKGKRSSLWKRRNEV
jgi:hypothetical protein